MKAQSRVLPVKPAKTFFHQRRGQYATLAQQTPLRSPKRTVGNPPPGHSSFCEFLYGTLRRQLAVRPALRPLPALRVRSRASKYIYIDAVRREFVTRETLLRYTSKSALVNNLISGNLWNSICPRNFYLTPVLAPQIHNQEPLLTAVLEPGKLRRKTILMGMMFGSQKRLAQNGICFSHMRRQRLASAHALPVRQPEARLVARGLCSVVPR
jgi:hypothetical protein